MLDSASTNVGELEHAQTLESIASEYFRDKDYNKAIIYFQQVLRIIEILKGVRSKEYYEIYLQLCRCTIEQEEEAIHSLQILTNQIDLAKEDFQSQKAKIENLGSDQADRINKYLELYDRDQQRIFDLSIKCYEKTLLLLSKFETLSFEDEIQRIYRIYKIASIYSLKGIDQTAIQYYQNALSAIEKIEDKSSSIKYAEICFQIGKAYEKIGKFQQSLNAYSQCYQIGVNIVGINQKDTQELKKIMEQALQKL